MDTAFRRRRRGPGGDPHALIERFGAQMLATARRYSAGSDDAEDAYQRAAEIVVRHRPTGTDDELLRWLRTTVKHEALAIGRQRRRIVAIGEPERLPAAAGPGRPAHAPDAHELAERLERLSLGAEALRRLKPQEIRALQLKAEGYSYAEICELTGWTYTKVNRCLTEGRQAFRRHIEAIESGSDCGRFDPSLRRVAGGEEPAEEVRAHLRTCLTCRSRLRELRGTPLPALSIASAAATAPAAGMGGGRLRSLLDSLAAAVQERWAALGIAAQERATAVGERVQHVAELAGAQKATAVVAASAALAGGGAATTRTIVEDARPKPATSAAAIDRAAGVPSPLAGPAPIERPSLPRAESPSAEAGRSGGGPAADGNERPAPPEASEFGPEAHGPEAKLRASTPGRGGSGGSPSAGAPDAQPPAERPSTSRAGRSAPAGQAAGSQAFGFER